MTRTINGLDRGKTNLGVLGERKEIRLPCLVVRQVKVMALFRSIAQEHTRLQHAGREECHHHPLPCPEREEPEKVASPQWHF